MSIYVRKKVLNRGHLDYCRDCGKVSSIRLDDCVVLRSEGNINNLRSPEEREVFVTLPEFCQCNPRGEP